MRIDKYFKNKYSNNNNIVSVTQHDLVNNLFEKVTNLTLPLKLRDCDLKHFYACFLKPDQVHLKNEYYDILWFTIRDIFASPLLSDQ